MSLSAEERLEKVIARGRPSGAYFLHGDVSRLRDDAARQLADAALDPATRDFNLDVFRGGETSPESLAAAIAMPPVMASFRVVLLYEAERLTPTACRVVEQALDTLPEDLVLIVTATVPKGSKKAFYRKLKEKAMSLEWQAPRDAEVPGWIIERATKRYGTKLSVEAAEALATAVGADPGLLDVELDKLCGADAAEVTLERVAALVPNVRPVNRWSWLDLVAERRYPEARRQLPDLLAGGESAVGLIAAMVDQHIYVGLGLAGGTKLVERTLTQAGKPYLRFKSRTFARQARRWSRDGIEDALRLLRTADRRAKSSGEGDSAVLEELLLQFEHAARTPARDDR